MKVKVFSILAAFSLLLAVRNIGGAEADDFSAVMQIRDLWGRPQCEAILRKTYFDACNAIDGSKFSGVLSRAAASEIQVLGDTDGTECLLALKNGVVLLKGGPSQTLFVDIAKKVDGSTYCLNVSLKTELENGRGLAIRDIKYPEGSLVAEVLKTTHFKQKLEKGSCVASIRISFGKISDWGSLERGMGYTVEIVLRKRDRIGKLGAPRGFLYQALSGMDPVESVVEGRDVSPRGESVFRSTVLENMSAITPSGSSPAIWALE